MNGWHGVVPAQRQAGDNSFRRGCWVQGSRMESSVPNDSIVNLGVKRAVYTARCPKAASTAASGRFHRCGQWLFRLFHCQTVSQVAYRESARMRNFMSIIVTRPSVDVYHLILPQPYGARAQCRLQIWFRKSQKVKSIAFHRLDTTRSASPVRRWGDFGPGPSRPQCTIRRCKITDLQRGGAAALNPPEIECEEAQANDFITVCVTCAPVPPTGDSMLTAQQSAAAHKSTGWCTPPHLGRHLRHLRPRSTAAAIACRKIRVCVV